MKINGSRMLEDCLDGSFIFELSYSEPVTEEAILILNTLGELEYFSSFPKPFYRLVQNDNFQLKGVEGETTSRLFLFKGSLKHLIDELNTVFKLL